MRGLRLWGRVGFVLLALTALPNVAQGPSGCRPATLEDLFGTTGNRFAGAIGFISREANRAPEAISGYGVGIDDVVVEWREFTLEEDTSDCDAICVGGPDPGDPCSSDDQCGAGGVCGGGSCATINLTTNNVYQGSTALEITVFDTTPSGNDCNRDGLPDNPPDFDCDNDVVPDVLVVVDSPQEPAGEVVVLNQIRRGVYRGTVPVSAAYDVPGTVFISTEGNDNPTVRATYIDEDDGTGRPCQASVDPAGWGRVQAETTFFLTPGQLYVTRTRLTDNGDDDGWADQGETVDLEFEVSNKTGQRITDVVLRVFSDDPNVGCIPRPVVRIGDLEPFETRFGAEAARFLVSQDAARTDSMGELTATLNVAMSANEFDGLQVPQRVVLDLDLDAVGGGSPTTYFESFESGFGSFTTMHLDEPLNPPESDLGNRPAGMLNADDHRCQYSDPDWTGGASFGTMTLQCFPNPNGASDRFWFDVTADRAFSGAQSLSFNAFLDEARGFTTPNSQLEAVRTIEPVNLGYAKVCSLTRTRPCTNSGDCPAGENCEFAQPVLSIKHQVSFLDHRSVNAQPGRSADRSILGVQAADHDGHPVGAWMKAYPFVNVYDSQANSNYSNCTFDPVDDGNTEEDFFDPTDPRRRFGPSSTCAPELNFAHQGDTDAPFNPGELGDASDGPGLQGAHGIGTWVEPRVDLSRFRGRRVRVRLLTTGLKLGGAIHWEQAFNFNPDPGDDGWFVDDVTITDAIADPPATVTADLKDNSGLPNCTDYSCGNFGADVVVEVAPPSAVSAAPGRAIELDLSRTSFAWCVSAVPQFRFWISGDGDLRFTARDDVLLRDWSDNPVFKDAPHADTTYMVEARCPTDRYCSQVAAVPVAVDCPSSGNVGSIGGSTPFLHRAPPDRRSILLGGRFENYRKSAVIRWTTGAALDAVRGDLASLRGSGEFGGEVCLADDYEGPDRHLEDATLLPNTGDGVYYLLRSKSACNEPAAGGSYGGVGEASTPARDAIVGCPGN